MSGDLASFVGNLGAVDAHFTVAGREVSFEPVFFRSFGQPVSERQPILAASDDVITGGVVTGNRVADDDVKTTDGADTATLDEFKRGFGIRGQNRGLHQNGFNRRWENDEPAG